MRVRAPRIAVCLMALGLAAPSAARAQSRPDPQAAYEPRSAPGSGQRFLEKLAGDWNVVKTFYPRSGDPVRSIGKCSQRMIHEGRFLESDFTFDGPAGKTTGLGVIGFEPESGVFTSFWTDSRSTRMSIRRSEPPFDGEQIQLYGRSLDSDGKGGLPRSRTVTRLEEGGRRILHRQYVPDSDGKERLMMELDMTRR